VTWPQVAACAGAAGSISASSASSAAAIPAGDQPRSSRQPILSSGARPIMGRLAAPSWCLPVCAPRASRACEERMRPGPSSRPTASATPNQATRPIATYHHTFISAFPPGGRHVTCPALTVRLWPIARRLCRPVKAEALGPLRPRLMPRPVPHRPAALHAGSTPPCHQQGPAFRPGPAVFCSGVRDRPRLPEIVIELPACLCHRPSL
jgi:hypothetical protein